MPIHTYTNWNSRPSDKEVQVEPFRKYFFICEGANTETFYFKKIIDLLLHIENSYEDYIKGHEKEFMTMDEKKSYSYAYKKFRDVTGMNAKKNSNIGTLAENVTVAIEQEKFINEDIHNIRGKVSSNVGKIIESIIKEEPYV